VWLLANARGTILTPPVLQDFNTVRISGAKMKRECLNKDRTEVIEMRTRRAAMTLALSSLFLLASSFAADTNMVKAVSDHFELYTNDNGDAAKAALTHFETVRGYMLRAFHAKDPFEEPVRLVGFKSAGEYEPYSRSTDPTGKAFSESSADRITIVMSTLRKEDYQYGVREYVRAFLLKVAPKMPYWLRTGFAELYCTLREEDGRIRMGSEPVRDFRHSISTDFDLDVLFSLNGGISREKGALDFYSENSNSNAPNAKDRASLANLEANSTVDYPVLLWQLTHMLMFNKVYSSKFGAFVQAACDENTDAAAQHVYGQSLVGLKQDLVLYIKMPSHAVLSTNFQLDKPVTPQVSQLSAAGSAKVLEDLKAAR
jgi:hypothetical protein